MRGSWDSIYLYIYYTFFSTTLQSLVPPLPLPTTIPALSFAASSLLPSAPSVFWDPLIQRPSSTSYLRSVSSNQTPLACRHILSSKKTKGRVAVGRVSPLPFNSHKSFNHDTDRNFFFSFCLPWYASIFCSSPLSSHVFNIPLALCPFTLFTAVLPNSRSSFFSSSPLPPSTLVVCLL